MLTVYMNDIEGFGKEDWADMLDNPHVPLEMTSCYEEWSGDGVALFRACDTDEFTEFRELWKHCPVKEFAFDLTREGESVAYSKELGDLLWDIQSLDAVKCRLYRLDLYDNDFAEEMDNVVDAFCAAYDRALARALPMLLAELLAARGE